MQALPHGSDFTHRDDVWCIDQEFNTIASWRSLREMDDSVLCSDDEHRKFQMLMGMLNWVVTIGRLDVAHATMSLSRFAACPRKGNIERALRVFGYLKRSKNCRVVIDSRDPNFIGFENDFAKD